MTKPLLISIDDDPSIGALIDVVASVVGFEAKTVETWKQFKPLIENTDPDVIVLDLIMPDRDGIEILQWLNEQKCTAPVILISAYRDGYLEAAAGIGQGRGIQIAATINKPIDTNLLRDVLVNLLSIHSMQLLTPQEFGAEQGCTLEELPAQFSVSHPDMDADHLSLFNLIFTYQDAVENDKGEDVMADVLARLKDYTENHFRREEELMEACGYPQYKNHCQVHQMLCAKVEQFANDTAVTDLSAEDAQSLRIAFVEFLNNWLRNHILSLDKNYEGWMKKLS